MTTGGIVVGVDGSSPAEHALRWAAAEAAAEGRVLVLLHATGAPWGDADGLDGVAADRVTSGTLVLDSAEAEVAAAFPDLVVHRLLEHVDARIALLEAAADSEMVVVGTRGRGPVARLVLGSVSAAVARHATCPVVVVRPGTAGAARHGVLVGVDAERRSGAAVELGFRLAAARDLPLTVLHAFLDGASDTPGPSEVPADTLGFEDRRRVLDEAVEGVAARFPDVVLHLVIGRGLVEECLERAAERMDLVVVGAHHSPLLRTLFDPHTERSLLTRATSVVAVVPEPGARGRS